MITKILFAAACTFVAGNVWAQGATPAPLSRVTVSNDVAKRTLMKAQINADTARAIVDSCVEFSKNSTPAQSIAVFVLAPTGDLVEAHVMDGVLPIGVETGLLKAKTALYARSSSAAVAQRFNNVDGRVIRLDLGKDQGLAYYFVGGGNADERCPYQALQKVLGPQPPLATAQPPSAGGAPAEGGRGGRGRGQQ